MSAADNRRIAALASERAVHRAFGWLHLHEPRMRRWQMEFLAIPAPPFGETERAAWFCDRFREIGLENARVDGEGNAVAELRPENAELRPENAGLRPENAELRPESAELRPESAELRKENAAHDGPVVLLSAHLDTVFPAGTDCTPREDGARILCPGACDNGAGLAALLGLAAALRDAKLTPASTVVFAANVGEEGEGDLRGMRHLFSRESAYAGRIQAAIALEGGGEATVVDRALGSRRLRVMVMGPGGHSWADAGRPNPILALAAALLEVAKLRLPSKPRTTLNCGVIRGGTSVNSIPESATADLDLRSVSDVELDRTELAVLHGLTRSVDASNHGLSEPLRMHVVRIGDRAAGALAHSSALFTSLHAVDRHLGLATEARIGSTDANLPLSLGVPAMAIGAGGVGWGIHTLQEGYDPTGREVALRRVLLLLLDACGMKGDALR